MSTGIYLTTGGRLHMLHSKADIEQMAADTIAAHETDEYDRIVAIFTADGTRHPQG